MVGGTHMVPDASDPGGNAAVVVQALVAAFRSRDVDDAMRVMTDDVRLEGFLLAQLSGRYEPYVGREGLEEYLGDMQRVWEEMRVTPLRLEETGPDTVVFEGVVHGKIGVEDLSRPLHLEFTLRDGLVARVVRGPAEPHPPHRMVGDSTRGDGGTMQQRTLGQDGLTVSALGLGCMGMSEFYGPGDRAESIATIHRALDLGANFLDTADMYGRGENERLVGEALAGGRREQAVVATKFGIVRGENPFDRRIDNSAAYIKEACEASLQRLGIDHIDLYYAHRRDTSVPIEETVGAMAELVAEGKVRHLGLSEVSAETLRAACAVHPIAALQSEWSLWTRGLEAEIVPAARELGVGLVPYSPIGRGFLTGTIRSRDDLDPTDFRRHAPRFQDENLDANLEIVDKVRAIAEEVGASPVQVALAWLLAQGDDVVPIPGTKRVRYLEENLAALDVELSDAQLAELDALQPPSGERYDPGGMANVEL